MLLINPKRKDTTPSIFPSPKKKKVEKPPPEDEDDEWDLASTQVDNFDMGATQVDFLDVSIEKEEPPAFKLTAFGDDDVLVFVEEKELTWQWSTDPLCIGRIKFLKMPDEHKNRISRKHFEIHCCNNLETDEREFWLVDFSANGTMVDGHVGYSGKKTLLEDGSAIGILLTPTKDKVLFGYSFSIGGGNGTPKKSKPLNGTRTSTKPIIGGAKDGQGIEKPKVVNKGDGEKTKNGVFAIPAPKSNTKTTTKTTTSTMQIKPKSGFMQGVRFSLVGYDEVTLSDPKKKKLIKDLGDQGATYVLHPEPTTVDVVVLSRNYFKDPSSFNINLPSLTSSLHIRFLGNTRWLEDCLREGRKVDLKAPNEILPPSSGGVVVLDEPAPLKGTTSKGIDPHLIGQLASMLRAEKKAVAPKWKVMAPLSTISACAGMLEGLEGSVEVLRAAQKGGDMDFMLGIRETHAAGYRHALLVLNKKDKAVAGMQTVEKVVTVVDASGLSSFSQALSAQRKENVGTKK